MSDEITEPEVAAEYSDNLKVREAVGLLNKAIKILPDSGYWTRAQVELEETIGYLKKRSELLFVELEATEKKTKIAFDEHYDRMEDTINTHCKRMQELKARAGVDLNIEFPRVPYQAEHLLEFAQKLDNSTPETFERMLTLVSALTTNQTKPE